LVGDWVFALELDAPPVATAAMGSRALYDRLPALAPADETHAPETLARLEGFRAINAVLGVDLQGRATSEVAGARRGGIGGLPDFARAAHRHPDGLSIIAVRADRIVERVERVSLEAIDVVVTEHGSADLRGRDPAERARALIAIAAPERRPALEQEL
jgi:acyl-CoA hydrolase